MVCWSLLYCNWLVARLLLDVAVVLLTDLLEPFIVSEVSV